MQRNHKLGADFTNRIAIISGGANGIGLATAQRFVAGGARVVLWDIDDEALAKARARFPEPATVLIDRVDVTNAPALEQAVHRVTAECGKIDILVTGAGITGPNCTAWEYPLDAWNRVLRTNLDGVMHCCRSVVPHMLRGGYGRIVTVASIGGKEGNAHASAYAASKAEIGRAHV